VQVVVGRHLVYCQSVGRGRPVFVVHGGPGLDHTYFRPWLDPLAKDAQLVFSDLPGSGRSERVPLKGGMDVWADGIDQLRAALGVERMVLLGHSFGGYVAQEYALRHGDRLDGLVLCCTTPAFDYPEIVMANAAKRATPEQLAVLQSGLSTPPVDDQAFRRAYNAILPLYFAKYLPKVGASMDAHMMYSAAAYSFGTFECLPGWSTVSRLPRLRTPTLIVSGRQDMIAPVELAGDRLQAGIPGAHQVIFEESGHFPFIEEQPAFLAALRGWLSSLPHAH
jgi:proline iminopeptidase